MHCPYPPSHPQPRLQTSKSLCRNLVFHSRNRLGVTQGGTVSSGRGTVKRKRYQVLQSSQTCNINSNIFNSMHFCGCCQSSVANCYEYSRNSRPFVRDLRGVGSILFSVLRQIAAFQSNVASDWLTCAQLHHPFSAFPPRCCSIYVARKLQFSGRRKQESKSVVESRSRELESGKS